MKSMAIFGRIALALTVVAAPLYAVNRVVSSAGGAPLLKQLSAVVTRQNQDVRPKYQLRAVIDWRLMTFRAEGEITVPNNGENLRDAAFFVFANAGGVGGADEKRLNIAIDSVEMDGQKVDWKLDGAVLHASWPQAQNAPVTLRFKWHGVVPRAPEGSGGIMEMMGGLGGDVGGLLGMPTTAPAAKPKNVDYGLYSYGNGILSLGAFWYPTLAMRQNGRWIDEAPEGLGDVAYAAMSDYDVSFEVPPTVMVVAPGERSSQGNVGKKVQSFALRNVRDCAVLMSDEYVPRNKKFDVGGKMVTVEAFTTERHLAKIDETIEVAGHALQIYAKRFGAYPYDKFIVAEGPMRGGAGGMEYSGMTAIASMLYDDLGAQLGALGQSLGGGMTGGPMGDFLSQLDKEAFGGDGKAPTEKAAPEANNPAADMLGGMLGEQKQIFDSILEVTIAHEVAHQWWAIGVGSDSQRAPWLDESLTNYSAMVYFEDRYGAAKAQQMIDLHLKTTYSMGRMLGNADAPVNKRTSQYSGNIQYGALVYGKGALFYGELRKLVGDAAFFSALRDYYARYDNRVADANDLLGALETAAPEKKTQIRDLYARWIEGAHGDEDISGGKAMDISDLLGGLMGGMQTE